MGIENIRFNNEVDFINTEIPNTWKIGSDSYKVTAYGKIDKNNIPDKMIYANWNSLYDNRWLYNIDTNKANADSAIAFICNEKSVKQNKTCNYSISYGVQNILETNDSVNTSDKIDISIIIIEFTLYGNITIQGIDIVFNGILYAPNGTVELNAKNLTINPLLDDSILNFEPIVDINVTGEQKENRLLTVYISKSKDIERFVAEKTVWNIYSIDNNNDEFVFIDDEVSNYYTKNLIIRDSGDYCVKIIVSTDKKSYTYSKIITIFDDIAPVANLSSDIQIAETAKSLIKLKILLRVNRYYNLKILAYIQSVIFYNLISNIP